LDEASGKFEAIQLYMQLAESIDHQLAIEVLKDARLLRRICAPILLLFILFIFIYFLERFLN
jgi:hypothetical protein